MRTITPILLALSLALPTTLAVWGGHGSWEPDHAADVTDLLMWAEPDTDPSQAYRRVYFNAWLSVEGAGVNTNALATQSRLITPDFQQPQALLGVWKDCNNDGYIGMAEGALMEYRSELLLDTGVCPPGASDFNRDDWVYEFLWIGSQDNTFHPLAMPLRMINDTEARVWGDDDLPGSHVEPDCYVNPQTGTFSSTGGVIAFADCSTERQIAGTVNSVDPTGMLSTVS